MTLTNIQYKNSENNNIADVSTYTTVIINPIVIAYFFETIYKEAFDYLLATSFKNGGFLRLVSIYFDIIEINSWNTLYLHYLV